MKKIALLALLLIYLRPTVQAQQHYIDSITLLLAKHPKQDTSILALLKWLSFYHKDTDPAHGIQIADSAIRLANKMGESGNYLAALYASKGVNYWAKGENDSALKIYTLAEQIFIREDNKFSLGGLYNNVSNALTAIGMLDSALVYMSKSRALFHELGDKEREAMTYNNMGVIYQYQAKLPQALDCLFKASVVFGQTGKKDLQAGAYTNIGIINRTLTRYATALAFYEKAMVLYKETGTKSSVGETLINMAAVYYDQKEFQKTISYSLQALKIFEETQNMTGLAGGLGNVGEAYAILGEYGKALSFQKRAITVAKENNVKAVMIVSNNAMSKAILNAPDTTLLQNGINPTTKYTLAEDYAQQSLQMAKESQMTDQEYYAWENLSHIYEARKDYPKALNAYKQFTTLKDSVFSITKKEEIARHEAEFEFEKEKMQIEATNLQKQQADKNKAFRDKAIIIATSILLLSVIVFYSLYRQKKKQVLSAQKEAKLKTQKAEAEVKMLVAQMNPHFIFNTINSINSYIISNGTNTNLQSRYLTKFAKLIRMVLESSTKKEISLARDLEILETYIQLEQKRATNGFEYEIVSNDNINMEKVMIPPMLLQPFVENSIWHGFAPKRTTGHLIIEFAKQQNMLVCTVKDNGIGLKESKLQMKEYYGEGK